MSFTQGLSGLNAASKDLEVIGNNVANANTVGFKQSQAQFADVFAAALSGAGASQIGIGAKLATVAQQFTQGNISITNSTLDMAINGPGFFILDNGHGIGYSRNGQFQLDKNGFIVSSTGHKLQGYPIDATTGKPMGSATSLTIPTAVANAVATGASVGAGVKGVVVGMNLDSSSTPIDPTVTPFDPANPNTFSNSTATTTYDSLGNAQTTTMYFVNVSNTGAGPTPPNTWDVYMTVTDPKTSAYLYTNPPGVPPSTPPAAGSWAAEGQLFYNTNGTFNSWTLNPANNLATTGFTPSGANLEQIPFDFTATTQFGSKFGVTKLTQDGYTAGQLSGFSISPDGTILGRYSNGVSKAIGQVALATFPNMQGLQPLGDNEWAESSASGQPTTNAPGSGNNGVLQTNSVEDSNVDLTAELVHMITAQRVYQANAQTIKTQDAMMQTIVNLR